MADSVYVSSVKPEGALYESLGGVGRLYSGILKPYYRGTYPYTVLQYKWEYLPRVKKCLSSILSNYKLFDFALNVLFCELEVGQHFIRV